MIVTTKLDNLLGARSSGHSFRLVYYDTGEIGVASSGIKFGR